MLNSKVKINVAEGNDAVFLPGIIHGCEEQVYIICYNGEANNGKGSFEIKIVDAPRILKIYSEVKGDADKFFEAMPDFFQGEWAYCDFGTETFNVFWEEYQNADFIVGRNGGSYEEMKFLVNWADKNQLKKEGL